MHLVLRLAVPAHTHCAPHTATDHHEHASALRESANATETIKTETIDVRDRCLAGSRIQESFHL